MAVVSRLTLPPQCGGALTKKDRKDVPLHIIDMTDPHRFVHLSAERDN